MGPYYPSLRVQVYFGSHAQVGSHIKVDDYNVKHLGGSPLPESMGA